MRLHIIKSNKETGLVLTDPSRFCPSGTLFRSRPSHSRISSASIVLTDEKPIRTGLVLVNGDELCYCLRVSASEAILSNGYSVPLEQALNIIGSSSEEMTPDAVLSKSDISHVIRYRAFNQALPTGILGEPSADKPKELNIIWSRIERPYKRLDGHYYEVGEKAILVSKPFDAAELGVVEIIESEDTYDGQLVRTAEVPVLFSTTHLKPLDKFKLPKTEGELLLVMEEAFKGGQESIEGKLRFEHYGDMEPYADTEIKFSFKTWVNQKWKFLHKTDTITQGDYAHLSWVYQRMAHQHDENENLDYMMKFKEILNKIKNNL